MDEIDVLRYTHDELSAEVKRLKSKKQKLMLKTGLASSDIHQDDELRNVKRIRRE
jgi:hypothetical protein